VSGTSDASHFIFKEYGDVSEGYDFESARTLDGVISGTASTALRADAPTVLARMNVDDDGCRRCFSFCPNFSKDEGLVICNGIEYSFQKHLGADTKNGVVANNILYRKIPRCLYLVPIDSGGVPKKEKLHDVIENHLFASRSDDCRG
jgi:hypothetical protein